MSQNGHWSLNGLAAHKFIKVSLTIIHRGDWEYWTIFDFELIQSKICKKKILSRWYPQWYIIWNNIKGTRVSNEKYDWKFWKLHYHNLWKALWIIYKYSLLSNFLITGHPKRRTPPLNFLYTGKTMVKSSHKTF